MSDQFKSLMFHAQDKFEYWLFHLHDVENDFINYFNKQIEIKLDHTPDLLNILENWLLEKYADHESILSFGNKEILDGASRYVGSEPIASLEELKKIESGVDERYVTDFEIRENSGLNKQDFRAYIGGRASRKLGKSGETDSIAL